MSRDYMDGLKRYKVKRSRARKGWIVWARSPAQAKAKVKKVIGNTQLVTKEESISIC